jgi:hypothetical protein
MESVPITETKIASNALDYHDYQQLRTWMKAVVAYYKVSAQDIDGGILGCDAMCSCKW